MAEMVAGPLFPCHLLCMSIRQAFILVMFGNVNSYIHVVTCWTKAKGIHFVLEMFICRQNTCVLYEGPTYRFGGTRMRVRKDWGGVTELFKVGCRIKTIRYQQDLLKYFVRYMYVGCGMKIRKSHVLDVTWGAATLTRWDQDKHSEWCRMGNENGICWTIHYGCSNSVLLYALIRLLCKLYRSKLSCL